MGLLEVAGTVDGGGGVSDPATTSRDAHYLSGYHGLPARIKPDSRGRGGRRGRGAGGEEEAGEEEGEEEVVAHGGSDQVRPRATRMVSR